MSDNQPGPDGPGVSPPADDRFHRIERIVRWVFWIGIAAAMVWVAVDLMIRR